MMVLYKIIHKATSNFFKKVLRSVIYKSERVGRNGKIFELYKFRTMKHGSDKGIFADGDIYTKHGRFLRKYKLDELPQLLNVLKGDMDLVGPRPEEKRTIDVIPREIREKMLSVKPGMSDLASIYFFDEERLLEGSADKTRDYWTKIKPMKFLLQMFYVENKCFSLDVWILWATIKRIIKEAF